MESKGFRPSRSKTKYLDGNFRGGEEDTVFEVTISGIAILKVEKFKYLG